MADDDSSAGSVFIEFSQEELVVLARLLGRAEHSDDLSGEVFSATRRSLLARRVLATNAGDDEIAAPIDRLLETMWAPALIGRAWRHAAGVLDRRSFGARPDLGVEQHTTEDGVVRIEPFAVEELLVRMLAHAQLEERPLPVSGSFAVGWGGLLEAIECARRDDVARSEVLLAAEGITEELAAGFCAAAANLISLAGAGLGPADSDAVPGGEVAWLDGGDHGLWRIPIALARQLCFDADDPFEGTPEACEVSAVDARSVAAELAAYLPAGPGASS